MEKRSQSKKKRKTPIISLLSTTGMYIFPPPFLLRLNPSGRVCDDPQNCFLVITDTEDADADVGAGVSRKKGKSTQGKSSTIHTHRHTHTHMCVYLHLYFI